MNFASDNCSGVAPEIMEAIVAANSGYDHSYGGDQQTQRLDALFGELFERQVSVFPVLTGGAANCLSLGTLVPPYGTILCHEAAHIHTDECGGPGLFTGGGKLAMLDGQHGKIDPKQLEAALAEQGHGVHSSPARLLSLTQATEWGTVYTPGEVAALAAIAHARELAVHMDGARFANALAYLGCSPAEMTWKAGVDVLSFGATKNGAMLAEAVVFFNTGLVRDFEYRRKQAGQLFSKMRFLSAQWHAYLADGLWLRLATHANAMAARLAGLQSVEGIILAAPVQANEVFLTMPEETITRLERAGADFYRWGAPADHTIRLVTSWATMVAEVDEFVRVAGL